MSPLAMIALALAVLVAAATIATRRKAVDPLASRRRGATPAKAEIGIAATWKLLRAADGAVLEQVASELRAGRKIDAIKLLREATGLDLTAAKRVADEIDAQIASDGPLARLLAPPAGE